MFIKFNAVVAYTNGIISSTKNDTTINATAISIAIMITIFLLKFLTSPQRNIIFNARTNEGGRSCIMHISSTVIAGFVGSLATPCHNLIFDRSVITKFNLK